MRRLPVAARWFGLLYTGHATADNSCLTVHSLRQSCAPSSSSSGNSNSSGVGVGLSSSSGGGGGGPASLPYPIILQHFLQAMNDGNKDLMEPFLHHNFLFEQAPMLPLQPKVMSAYKFDFLKRAPDARSAFASRVVEVTRMVEQGNVVVVESKATGTVAVDVGTLAKKGQALTIYATLWIEFDPATRMILKLKAYECVSPPS